jgi:hypothetical protein
MKLRTLITLAPTPAFLVGLVWELAQTPNVCGANSWSMPAMWLLMAIAHAPSWWLWWDQRELERYRLHLPDKQQ